MNKEVNLTKRVKTAQGPRFCPVVMSANGRVKPDYVLVGGREERHPEGAYYLEWYQGGKRVRQSVGKDASTATARRQRQQQVLASKAAGLKLADESTADGVLLADAVSAYLEDIKIAKKPKTHAAYRTALEYFLESCNKRRCTEIERQDLLRFSAFLRDVKKLQPRTVYNKFENVMSFLKANGVRGLVSKNDWPRYVEDEPEVYEREDLDKFFTACADDERLWFEFFLMTGMREQEAMHTTWDDINMNRGVVSIRYKREYGFSPKAYKGREIPIPNKLVKALKNWKSRCDPECPLVFPTAGCRPKLDFLDTCKAVALGSYYLYAYQQGDFEARLATWGVWANGYYKSQNEQQDGVYQGPRLCAYERTKLLAGDPSAVEVCFQMAATDSFNPRPADVDSIVQPPSGQDEMFFGLWDSSHLSLYTVHPDFANPQNSFATGTNGSQLVEVPAFTLACNGLFFGACVPQPGTNNLLQSFGQLVDTRVAYRDDNPALHATAAPPLPAPLQHWYVVHDSTADGGNQAPRWYEFTAPQRITPPSGVHLFQSGTYAPDAKHRWISSIARDKKRNILLGYNLSSSNTFPSIAIAGRTLQDPLGTLENEVTVINGNGSQLGFPDWGDFSDMRIDPDGCTFWYTNQYYMTTALRNWSTQIASARFSNCN